MNEGDTETQNRKLGVHLSSKSLRCEGGVMKGIARIEDEETAALPLELLPPEGV